MSFPGAGGDNSVFVSIDGSSVGLDAAARMASDSLMATAGSVDLLSASFDALTASASGVGTLNEEIATTATASADGLDTAGAAATATAGRFDGLIAAARAAAQALASVGGVISGGIDSAEARVGRAVSRMGLTPILGALGNGIEGLAGKIWPFISSMGAMVAGFAALGVIEDAINEVKNFTDSLVELNIQTEKNQFSWRYLYGGGNNAQGAQVAQGIADWTKKFSMQIPYTRQDLLNAVSGLAPMGLSAEGLEHYMPMIADLAATRDPNANLAQVAQVIMSASMGYTRMLKYDLKINPEDLIQYGLNATGSGVGMHINDPSTLLPALENYTKAKGLSGAAKDISTETWWGAWSSFMDRIQNFELDSGSGLFKNMKDDLNGLSSWIDTHQGQISKFADLLSGTLGGAFKSVATDVGDFVTGLGSSGVLDFLGLDVGKTPATPHQPANAMVTPGPHASRVAVANAKTTNHLLGVDNQSVVRTPPPAPDPTPWERVGTALGTIVTGMEQFADFINTMGGLDPDGLMKSIGDNLKAIGNALTPEDKQLLKDIGVLLLAIVGAPIIGGFLVLSGLLAGFVWWLQTGAPAVLQFTKHIQDGLGGAVKWTTDRIGDLIGKIKDLLTWLHILPAEYGGLGVSSTPKGKEDVTKDQRQTTSLHLNGGYASASNSTHNVQLNIYGSSTMEVMKVIDYTMSKQGKTTNLQSRASSGYGAYQFGTLGGLR